MSASGPAGSPSGTGSDGVRERIVAMALEIPELSPRELATRFIDAESWRVQRDSRNIRTQKNRPR